MLDSTTDPDLRALREAEAAPARVKLPNFQYPMIQPIRADKFVLDLSENRQRDPEKRKRTLIKQFGENGEKFDFDQFEVISALPRPDGTFFPCGGMGRLWAVLNLLKRPDLELPTLIKRQMGDQKEKRAFVKTVTGVVPIKEAELFMTYGHMDGAQYSIHRAIVGELDRLGLTTVPGAGPAAMTLSASIFSARLGKLTEAYNLAREWWFPAIDKKGRYKHKVEGSALSALAALLYTYDGSGQLDWKRLEQKFKGLDYSKFKEAAVLNCGSDNTTHQGRDDAPAVLKYMIIKYNQGVKPKAWKYKSLQFSDTLQIREDFTRESVLFDKMHDTWRMFDRANDKKK